MTDKEALKRIAANVRRLREARGISMNRLAIEIENHAMAVKRIEEETHMPGVGLLTRIAEFFDCSLDDLVSEHVDERSKKNLSSTA